MKITVKFTLVWKDTTVEINEHISKTMETYWNAFLYLQKEDWKILLLLRNPDF